MPNLRKQEMKQWIAEMPIGDPFGGAPFGQRNDPLFSLPVAAQVVAGGILSNVISKAITKEPSIAQAAAPTLTPPTPMPGPTETKAAERASIAEQLRRRGRASTVLTDQAGTTDKLGA